MQPIQIITSLKRCFSIQEASAIIRSLRYDPLIWETVQDDAFFNSVLSQENLQVEDWNPANLAFSHIHFDLKASELREAPLRSVESSYRRQATLEYQQFLQTTDSPLSLDSVGLLALALRERRRVKGNWSDLAQELFKGPAELEFLRWRTPLACLLTIIPDPAELLWEIGNENNQDLILHILLSNPLSSNQRSDLLSRVIQRYPVPMRLSFLQEIQQSGEENLSKEVAHSLAEGSNSSQHSFSENEILLDQPVDLTNLSEEIQAADYYLALKDSAFASTAFKRIKAGLRQAEAVVELKLYQTQINHPDTKWVLPDLEKIYQTYPDSPAVRTVYAEILCKNHRESEADAVIQRDSEDLTELILAANFEKRKPDHGRASEIALKAWGQAIGDLKAADSEVINSLCSLLSDLGHTDEALELIQSASRERINDPQILLGKSRLEKMNGFPSEAKTSALFALAASPENLDSHRWLASLYEADRDFSSAIQEWQEILNHPEAQLSDVLSLAKNYFAIGYMEKVIEICNSALEKESSFGQAHLWLAKSFLALNRSGEAQEHLLQAVHLAPEEEEAWQLLAAQQQAVGKLSDACQTLKAAVNAVPHSARLHYDLGNVLKEQGNMTEALMEFSHAAELDPHNRSIASAYGLALLNIGRFTEAESVLRAVADQYPDDPELAEAYAKSLIAQEKHDDALSPLRAVLASQPKSIEPYLNFASSGLIAIKQIQIDENLPDPSQNIRALGVEIQSALTKALDLNPDHIQANILSGDFSLFQRDYQSALQHFSHVAELYQGGNNHIKSHINYGMGQAALGLENFDVAVAALEEAARLDPHQSEILRDLARAYQQANLPDAAMQTAHNAISLDANDPDSMVWFSNFCMDMKQDTEAMDAIRSAIQLMPDNPDLRFQLARLQSKQGDTKAAAETYQSILEIPSLSARVLDQIARIFESSNNPSFAITALERLLKENPLPEISIFTRLISAYHELGDVQAAIQTTRHALICYPDEIQLHTMLIDLLVETSQVHEAIQHIESLVSDELLYQMPQLSEKKKMLFVQIELRHIYLLRALGKITDAYTHAKVLLKNTENNFEALFLTADLEHTLLKDNLALTHLQNYLGVSGDELNPEDLIPSELISDQDSYDHCICLLAELALQANHPSLASSALDLLDSSAIHDWICAIQSRILAATFDFQKAHKLLDRAYKSLSQRGYHPGIEISPVLSENTPVWNRASLYFRYFHSPDAQLAVADAALSLKEWNQSIEILSQACADTVNEPLPHLKLVQVLIHRAEFEQICQELYVVQNSAGKDALSEQVFETILQHLAAIQLSDAHDLVSRWKLRAKICFYPDSKSIETFQQLKPSGGETAALIAGANRTNVALDLKTIAEQYPEDPFVQFQIALSFREIDPSEGLQAIHVALKAMPIHPLYNALQAFLQKNDGDIPAAIQSLNDALDQWPEEHRWHAFLADLYAENNDLDLAIDQLQQAIEIDPMNFDYLLQIAKDIFHQGDLVLAQKKAKDATLANPDDSRPWMLLAKIHQELGEEEEAIADAERAITLAPNDPDPLVFSANLSLKMEVPAIAMDRAKAALRIDPKNTEANLAYIRALVASGLEQEAIASMDTAAFELEDPVPIMIEKAALIHDTQGNPQALTLLKQLSLENPGDLRILKPMAQYLAEEGLKNEALQMIQDGLDENPDDEELHLFAGKILHSQGQLDQAIDHLSKTILVNPAEMEAYLELGKTYTDRREFSKAISVYQQAITFNPDDYRPYYLAGLCNREIKNYPEAEKLLRAAAGLQPEDVSIRRQLGAIIALNLVHKPKEVPVEL